MLSRDKPVCLYYQIELQIREEIERGALPAGCRLPTESELSQRFGVSRITVREALRRLEEDGLISRTAGRGTFVQLNAAASCKIQRRPSRLLDYEQELIEQGGSPSVQLLSFERWPADARAAALMHINAGDLVFRARQLASLGDSPLWVGFRYLSLRIGEDVARQAVSLVPIAAFLNTVPGLGIASAWHRISAGSASALQAEHLRINPRDPVLISEYAYYDNNGLVAQAGRSFIRADRYAYVFEVPFAPDAAPPLVP